MTKRLLLTMLFLVGCGDSFDGVVEQSTDGGYVPMTCKAPPPVVYCDHGYQRIIFDPSDETVYCIPVIGTDPPKVDNPCGTGRPVSHNDVSGVYVCTGYDAGVCPQ